MNGFLFDENVPLPLQFRPSSKVVHATSLGTSRSDDVLWQYAAANHLAIVSKDTDFADRIMLTRPPPWIVRLRFGNLRRAAYEATLAKVWPQIEALLPAHKLINVFADHIESVRD